MILFLSILFSAVSCLCYLGLIIFFTHGWYTGKTFIRTNQTPRTKTSIIIAFRNEEENMLPLLISLSEQDYPLALFQVILVDDHSGDGSYKIAEEFILNNGLQHFTLLSLTDAEGFSKKTALKKGIECSTGTLIVTTDADCVFQKSWLSTMVDFYEHNKCRLISGPVAIDDRGGMFSKFQSLEFLSLMISGAGALMAGKPVMANGANLCFERSLYNELNGYLSHNKFVSGDDIFMLHAAKKHVKNKNEICFLKNPGNIVLTKGVTNFRRFLNQRIRWASKSTGYKDPLTIFTAFVIFFFNLSIFSGCFLGFFNEWIMFTALILFFVKLVVDFPLIYSGTGFIGEKYLLWLYIPMQIIYPAYIVFVATLSFFIKFDWKGRSMKQ